MRHGTNSCYQKGCRRTECVRAHKVAQGRWLHKVAVDGPRLVDAKLVMAAVDYCREAGITWSRICSTAGCPGRSLADMTDVIHVDTRRRLLHAMRTLLDERQAQLQDAWSALDLAAGWDNDSQMWPTAPLLAHVAEKGLSVKAALNETDRCYLYRSEVLDTDRAERVCKALDVLPEDIWPDWFGAGGGD